MDFPQYRKLNNSKAFYKIVDNNSFEEIKLMGTKKFYHIIKAQQYPEKLKIIDMLELNGYEASSPSEWLNFFDGF